MLTPPAEVEERLARHDFEIVGGQGSRFEGDRTKRKHLEFPNHEPMLVKWAEAPVGGEAFNNNPRYEVAAYELQKLYLDPADYVVPPTVVRWMPLGWYRAEVDPRARETVRGAGAVLVVLQYWLWNVTTEDVWDRERFEADTAYARSFGRTNLLTYLIRHMDANHGNFLRSEDAARPRIFSVDNGVAFRSERSDRGDWWRRLRVDRLPREAVDRLSALGRDELRRRLGVLAQFERRLGDVWIPTVPTENLNPRSGIRLEGDVLQIGLTESELSDVWKRMERLKEDVDQGKIRLF